MTGGALPVNGGLVVGFNRMNRILEIDQENMIARLQPGVITAQFQDQVKRWDCFTRRIRPAPVFRPWAAIWLNARADRKPSNTGYTGLRAGAGSGFALREMIRTGVRTAKGVVGYDLTRLIVGSEGTLAMITEGNREASADA